MPFRYREGIVLGGGAASAAAALGDRGRALGDAGRPCAGSHTRALALRRPVAGAMARVGPSSGFGPRRPPGSRAGAGRCGCTLARPRATSSDVHLEADGHPGYLATARLLGEAGMLLAEDGATPERGGALTPAAALGTACIARFERAHLRFSVGGLSAPADAAGTRSGR